VIDLEGRSMLSQIALFDRPQGILFPITDL